MFPADLLVQRVFTFVYNDICSQQVCGEILVSINRVSWNSKNLCFN